VAAVDQIEAGCELVTFTVANARPVDAKTLFALVDVEIQIAGVAFTIRGVQARRIPNGGTSVELPTFKDSGGIWRAAVQVPELQRAMGFDDDYILQQGSRRDRIKLLGNGVCPPVMRQIVAKLTGVKADARSDQMADTVAPAIESREAVPV
jgi:hypothetical protein